MPPPSSVPSREVRRVMVGCPAPLDSLGAAARLLPVSWGLVALSSRRDRLDEGGRCSVLHSRIPRPPARPSTFNKRLPWRRLCDAAAPSSLFFLPSAPGAWNDDRENEERHVQEHSQFQGLHGYGQERSEWNEEHVGVPNSLPIAEPQPKAREDQSEREFPPPSEEHGKASAKTRAMGSDLDLTGPVH